MVSKLKIGLWLLLVGLLTGNKLFSQEEEKRFTKKNLIEVYVPFYSFLDGNKTHWKYNYYKKNRNGTGAAIGVSYTKKIFSQDINLITGIEIFNFIYPFDSPQQKSPGSIFDRNAILFNLGVTYPFAFSIFGDFSMVGNVIYRRGYEGMIVGYPRPWETTIKDHVMRDLGLCTGLRVSKDLSKRFVFSSEALVTYFVYRYDRGDAYSFDNGSSKAMLTLNFGLGYRF